jgi:hypothetical protein
MSGESSSAGIAVQSSIARIRSWLIKSKFCAHAAVLRGTFRMTQQPRLLSHAQIRSV